MKEPILEVKNLTKKFGDFTAVDNVSFELGDGEILGLLGPNGAGKTTTIQMLLGVMESTSGSISYFGKPFQKHREEVLKNINFSSGYIGLPWLQTVEEILTVFARFYEVPGREKRIQKLLATFDIENLYKRQFYKLSAGERSRVLLVKAFINYPKILLLDEPTASLDPDIAEKVREFLKKEKEEFQVSMLFTSHNMPEVEEVCDRVVFINHGRIIKEGSPIAIAKTVVDCKLQIMVTKNKEKALSLLKRDGMPTKEDKSYLTITIPEKNIAQLLTELARNEIEYEEITIEKPSLEDFFLSMARKNKYAQ